MAARLTPRERNRLRLALTQARLKIGLSPPPDGPTLFMDKWLEDFRAGRTDLIPSKEMVCDRIRRAVQRAPQPDARPDAWKSLYKKICGGKQTEWDRMADFFFGRRR